MKNLRFAFVFLLLCALGFAQTPQEPQTEDLGLGAFANEHGAILMAVDAALVDLQINNPYVMFIMYMASKDMNQGITIDRNEVVMVYNGKEYHMPSVKELRENYNGEIHDIDFYRHLGKEGIISSWARFYRFPPRTDFFPELTLRGGLAVDQGHMYGTVGFRTKLYFKNPGFKKGDTIVFRVHDKKQLKLTGEVTVVLK